MWLSHLAVKARSKKFYKDCFLSQIISYVTLNIMSNLNFKLYKGRVSRSHFFLSTLFVGILLGVIGSSKPSIEASVTSLLITVVWILAMTFLFYLQLSFWSKRFHDVNKSGWWSLLYFVPVVNVVIYIILIFYKGDVKKNKYGPIPRNLNL